MANDDPFATNVLQSRIADHRGRHQIMAWGEIDRFLKVFAPISIVLVVSYSSPLFTSRAYYHRGPTIPTKNATIEAQSTRSLAATVGRPTRTRTTTAESSSARPRDKSGLQGDPSPTKSGHPRVRNNNSDEKNWSMLAKLVDGFEHGWGQAQAEDEGELVIEENENEEESLENWESIDCESEDEQEEEGEYTACSDSMVDYLVDERRYHRSMWSSRRGFKSNLIEDILGQARTLLETVSLWENRLHSTLSSADPREWPEIAGRFAGKIGYTSGREISRQSRLLASNYGVRRALTRVSVDAAWQQGPAAIATAIKNSGRAFHRWGRAVVGEMADTAVMMWLQLHGSKCGQSLRRARRAMRLSQWLVYLKQLDAGTASESWGAVAATNSYFWMGIGRGESYRRDKMTNTIRSDTFAVK